MEEPFFAPGSRCLAYHGPLLYEARILRVYSPQTGKVTARVPQGGGAVEEVPGEDLPSENLDQVLYFVHYKGWKATWDEWVVKDRVMLFNEENVRMQKELKQQAMESMRKKNAAPTATTGSAGSTPVKTESKAESGRDSHHPHRGEAKSGTKRGTRADEEDNKKSSVNSSSGSEISIDVPESLKSRLVDDWEYVTKNHLLVPLPRSPNVVDILREYRDTKSASSKLRQTSAEADITDEVISGIKLYFDKSLGNILLYRFERQQYLEIRRSHPDTPMSEIYGVEHLLRLFVTLPGLIAQTNMDPQSITHLKHHVEDLLQFIASKSYILDKYIDPDIKYETLARGGAVES